MADQKVKVVEPYWVAFDGMAWPRPCGPGGELEWRLRNGHTTKQDLLAAASYLSAYVALVNHTERERRRIVRAIKSVRTKRETR